MENRGVVEARNAAFVLVAGGLGERLGYNGIKVNKSPSVDRIYILFQSMRNTNILLTVS